MIPGSSWSKEEAEGIPHDQPVPLVPVWMRARAHLHSWGHLPDVYGPLPVVFIVLSLDLLWVFSNWNSIPGGHVGRWVPTGWEQWIGLKPWLSGSNTDFRSFIRTWEGQQDGANWKQVWTYVWERAEARRSLEMQSVETEALLAQAKNLSQLFPFKNLHAHICAC